MGVVFHTVGFDFFVILTSKSRIGSMTYFKMIEPLPFIQTEINNMWNSVQGCVFSKIINHPMNMNSPASLELEQF